MRYIILIAILCWAYWAIGEVVQIECASLKNTTWNCNN